MSKTPKNTVADTGAMPNQYLVGIAEQPLNRGLRIKVHRGQAKGHGDRVVGSFDLVAKGTGTYAKYLPHQLPETFANADELIDAVRAHGRAAVDCTNILNRNKPACRRESESRKRSRLAACFHEDAIGVGTEDNDTPR
jgi:hypothetical protein